MLMPTIIYLTSLTVGLFWNTCRHLRILRYSNPEDKIHQDPHHDLRCWGDKLLDYVWPVESLKGVPESMHLRSLCGERAIALPHKPSECKSAAFSSARVPVWLVC